MRKRRLPYTGICLIALLIAREGAGACSRLTVRVCNFSRADDEMLSQAETFARRIFEDAGIETDWITANDPGKLDPSMLTVQIFEARSKRADTKDAFGAAFITRKKQASFLADVFFRNIEEEATTRKEAAVLLALVMAHEVGHLLLGAAHRPGTIMTESLSIRDVPLMLAGRVRFNPAQSERLCLAVSLRQRMPIRGRSLTVAAPIRAARVSKRCWAVT